MFVIGRFFMLVGFGFTDLVIWILYFVNILELLVFFREEWRVNLYCFFVGLFLIKKGVWFVDKRRKYILEVEFFKGLNYVDL